MRKSLRKLLAIPLDCQEALHSHSAKSSKNGDISRWLASHSQSTKPAETLASRWLMTSKWLVMVNQLKRPALPLGNHSRVARRLVILAFFGVVGLMLSITVSAVGMGGINVVSALGQQLKADIELVAISKTEKDSLVARLASPETYKSAGLEYPYNNKFKFQVENRPDGKPYIKASSAQPVNDPFVSLLIELSWSSGKLSREYTFLLDPPGYVSEQPAPPPVQAVVPEVQAVPPVRTVVPEGQTAVPEGQVVSPEAPAASAAVVPPSAPAIAEETAPMAVEQAASAVTPEQQAPPTEVVAPSENIAPVEPAKTATTPTAATPEVAVVRDNKEWVAVRRGDTLYKIAEQYKLTDMSVERMLVAMYHTNTEQFDGRNMNRIKAGKILHLPSQQELNSVSLPAAIKEIHAQTADWNAYRQKLAKVVISNPSASSQQVATGKIGSSVTEVAPVAKESAKEVLKLSKGEAPQDRVGTRVGGKSMSAQDKKNAAQEDAVAQSKASKEAQQRTALLEKNLQDMQRLAQLKAQLKTEAAATLAQPVVPAKAATSEVAATSAVKPTPIAPPKPKPVKSEPSLVDQILDEPLYLAAGAGALLVLGGLGFLVSRRKKSKQNRDEITTDFIDVGSTSSRIAPPVIPSPDTGDFTRLSATQVVTPPQSEDVDPISEADLFLNFGRDVQAEAILKEALQLNPNNHLISLKLLGIYVNRKDTNSFTTIARQLQDSGDAEAWQQAAAMGRKLEPNNPMYSGGGAIEDARSATMQMTAFDVVAPKNTPTAASLDFDLNVGTSTAKYTSSPEQDFLSTSTMSGGKGHASPGAEMDFDITANKNSSHSGQAGTMDFDITTTNPSMPAAEGSNEAASPLADEMVFDVATTSHTRISAAPQPKPIETEDGGITFMLDFPVDNIPEESASIAASGSLSGINLNFDDIKAQNGSTPANKDDQWQEVATKLDLAKAYQEMGDGSGAREILEEVLREGNTEQRETAQTIIQQLG